MSSRSPNTAFLLILLAGIAVASSSAWPCSSAAAWLINEAESSKPKLRPGPRLEGAQPPPRRQQALGLSRELIIELALRVQDDNSQEMPATPVNPNLRDLLNHLGDCQLKGKLTRDQSKRFFANCARSRLRLRPLVVHGDAAPIEISHMGIGPAGNWWTRYDTTSLAIGDHKPTVGGKGSTSGFGGGGATTYRFPSPPPGDHPVPSPAPSRSFTESPSATKNKAASCMSGPRRPALPSTSSRNPRPSTDIQTANIVLRPSEKVARETIDLFEMWNKEVAFKDVPVVPLPRDRRGK